MRRGEEGEEPVEADDADGSQPSEGGVAGDAGRTLWETLGGGRLTFLPVLKRSSKIFFTLLRASSFFVSAPLSSTSADTVA